MRSKYILPLFALPLLAACGDDASDAYIEPEIIDPTVFTREFVENNWEGVLPMSGFTDATETVPADTTVADYEDYYENWLRDEDSRDIVIKFDGETAAIDWQNEGKKTKEAVKITTKGAHVVIRNERITDGEPDGRARMNYILQGSTNNGSLRIYSNKKFMVTLDNVSITNPEGSAINAQKSTEKKRMFLNLLEGTRNYLCDAKEYTDTVPGEDEKGTLFSEGKLIFCGKGELHVAGQRSHAIAADDRIRIHAGVTIEVDSAMKDGIHTNDAFLMTGGLVKIFAQKDAVQGNTDPEALNKAITLAGGRIYTCSNRPFNAANWGYNGASFCAICREYLDPALADGELMRMSGPDYYILYK